MDGQDLRRLRKRLGLKQTELAERLGTTGVSVWRWEHGTHPISARTEAALRLLAESMKRRRP